MSRVFDPSAVAKASQLQRLASNPALSVWVSADAGTGKTEVLTQRVLRLLLDDPTLRPDQILALTFTKAGASEMALRLPNPRRAHDRKAWGFLNDAELRTELRDLLQREVSDADIVRARDLPRAMAERPPWVTTIHGFCQQVLSRFPHEANVPEGFEVLDDVAQTELLRKASQRALEHASGAEAEALKWLLGQMADSSLSTLTDLLVRDWTRLRTVVGRRDALRAQLRERLEVGDVPPMGFALGVAELKILNQWTGILRGGTANDQKQAERNEAITRIGEAPWHVMRPLLVHAFLTDGEPRKSIATNKTLDAMGQLLVDDVRQLQARVHEQTCAERRYFTYRMTMDVLVWGACVADHYTSLKRERGALDFADLIAATEDLLLKNTDGWRDWVMYRLDKNLRHLMVDETQDNSPAQGHLVELLARELLSGDVGEDGKRTVFAVGDVKQSIYRFQGAASELFVRLRNVMSQYEGAEFTGLSHSFRTSSAVLDVVNEVFVGDAGLVLRGDDETAMNHQSVMPSAYGRVEIWPLVPSEKKPDVAPWTPPDMRLQREAGPLCVAKMVAAEILRLVREKVVLDATGSACTFGDVMILTQRNEAAAQVLAALRGAGVPAVMTGADDELPMAADDLLALMRALWNPADSLALAQVVKSPLVGWNDAQVLAWRLACKQGTAWDALRAVESSTAEWMVQWRERLLTWTPYRWLVTLLHEHDVVNRYGDVRGVDALLDTMLREKHVLRVLVRHEQGGITLPKMVGTSGNRVRIMTVHQSKGLEAPVVFMVDTTRKATARNAQREKLLFDMPTHGQLEGVLYWGAEGAGGPYQDALEAAERGRKRADSYRLLYVAMTRAKERLVVCGWESKGTSEDDDGNAETWYAMLTQARERAADAWRQEGEVWVREHGATPVADAIPQTADAVAELPAWMGERLPAVDDVALAPTLSAEQQQAVDYGTLVHRLLAVLPTGDEARVRTVVEAWVAREVEAVMREQVLAHVMGVWRAAPEVFGAGSRAEVAIGLADGSVGRIDRLVVREDAVWIIDFKTERVVPERVPPAYVRQLEDYAAAMRRAFPHLPIRCAIVWVNGVRVDWIT